MTTPTDPTYELAIEIALWGQFQELVPVTAAEPFEPVPVLAAVPWTTALGNAFADAVAVMNGICNLRYMPVHRYDALMSGITTLHDALVHLIRV